MPEGYRTSPRWSCRLRRDRESFSDKLEAAGIAAGPTVEAGEVVASKARERRRSERGKREGGRRDEGGNAHGETREDKKS